MKTVTVKTDSGRQVACVYGIKSVDQIISSHTMNGTFVMANDRYPKALQPRNRQNAAMAFQIARMAVKLDPNEVSASVYLNQGAPVVRRDGVVLNGNGRSMAIARAYAINAKSAANYKAFLVDNAAIFGVDADVVRGIDKPILVREIEGNIDAALLSDIIHSTLGGVELNPFEQAKIDAAMLTLDDFNWIEDSDLTVKANAPFVNRVIARIAKPQEQNKYYSKDGINADAIVRVKRAIYAAAYDDDGLISKMAESTDDDIKNVSKALESSAVGIAKLKLQQKAEIAFDCDFTPAIARAVSLYERIKTSAFKTVERYLQQLPLFDGETPEVEMLMRFFEKNKRGAKWIASMLNNVVRVIAARGCPRQETIFGEAAKPITPHEAIDAAIALTNAEKSGEPIKLPSMSAVETLSADSVSKTLVDIGKQFAVEASKRISEKLIAQNAAAIRGGVLGKIKQKIGGLINAAASKLVDAYRKAINAEIRLMLKMKDKFTTLESIVDAFTAKIKRQGNFILQNAALA